MSVQILDTPVFNYLRSGIEKAAYNTTVNEWYFQPISIHFKGLDIEIETLRLVRSWAAMNELSYCGKYKEDYEGLDQFIQPTFTHKPLTPLQFIKYVQCLIYNIEKENIAVFTNQQSEDLNLLKEMETAAMTAYITSQEEYKNATWSN